MDGYICWVQRERLKANVEITTSGTIEVTYREESGSDYRLILESKDGINYGCHFNQNGHVNVRCYENEDDILLFGQMKEDGICYYWWVEIDKA
jgi:hypothetical protein